MITQQASNNGWRKGFFGLVCLTKIRCLDLLAGLSYSFPTTLFCYTFVISQMNTVQLYPQYGKTLELSVKHDKHIS